MTVHSDLSKRTKINDNLFLSGIFPLDENYSQIKKLNIKYILSCLDRNYISEVHDKIMMDNPDIKILYLPYNDDINQNLWQTNKNQINIIKYANCTEEYDKLLGQLNIYHNKPMIEIGYHFINNAVESDSKILIHCIAGISRSVSIVIYYLMKKHHMNFDDAFKMIKNKRKIANPNQSFKLQLLEYQNKREKYTENDAKNSIIKTKNTSNILDNNCNQC